MTGSFQSGEAVTAGGSAPRRLTSDLDGSVGSLHPGERPATSVWPTSVNSDTGAPARAHLS